MKNPEIFSIWSSYDVDLSPEEMSHLTGVCQKPESMANRRKAWMQRAAIFVCSKRLLHIFFDGLAEIVNGLLIAFGGGFNDAVLQMVLQDDLAGIVNSGAHSCNLYENFAAVPAFFYHPAHGLQMADGAG